MKEKEKKMAFVNEYIPKEDFEKYGLETINNRMNGLRTTTLQWTIDREQEIWLRLFYEQHDYTSENLGYTGKVIWDFYWKGTLMSVTTKYITTKSESENNGVYYALISLVSLDIPSSLLPEKKYILKALKQAFITYSGVGIYSSAKASHIDLEYEGVLI